MTVNIEIDEANIKVAKNLVDGVIYDYAVKIPIKFTNLTLEDREKLCFPTKKEVLGQIVPLDPAEIPTFVEYLWKHYTPDEWDDAKAKQMILDEGNARIEFKWLYLKTKTKEQINIKDLGF